MGAEVKKSATGTEWVSFPGQRKETQSEGVSLSRGKYKQCEVGILIEIYF